MKTHFKVVVLDETSDWAEDIQRRAGGALFGAYLFDANRVTHCCEITPSYELWPLYTSAWKCTDELHEEILTHEGHDVMYMHCHVIDSMPEGCFFDDGEDDLGDDHDEWEEIRERTEDRLRGNVMIEFPKGYEGPTFVLPPDPEDMNEERASWATAALLKFREVTRCDFEDAPSDLIANMMHWCDRNGLKFESVLERARQHYQEETRA